MAGTIKITEIGDYCKGNLEQLLRSAVLQTDKRLKKTSPVDTGRFSASWQVGENAAPVFMMRGKTTRQLYRAHRY
jgi:hypothetical protein